MGTVFVGQFQDAFTAFIGLHFMDLGEQCLTDSPAGGGSNLLGFLQKISGIISLCFFPFQVVYGKMLFLRLISVLSIVGQATVNRNALGPDEDFHYFGVVGNSGFLTGVLERNGVVVLLLT